MITGCKAQGVTLLAELLREYGNLYPLIKKSVGTIYTAEFNKTDCKQATIRYYIDNKIYKLDKNYELDSPLSPYIPRKDAHLVIGLDPHETLANLEYISQKTLIILNAKVSKKHNEKSIGEIINLLDQFARITISMDFDKLNKQTHSTPKGTIYIILGVIAKEFKELIRKEYLVDVIKNDEQHDSSVISCFQLGYFLGH